MKLYIYNDLYFNIPKFGEFDGYIHFFSSLQSNSDYNFRKLLPSDVIETINFLTSQYKVYGLYLDSSTLNFLNVFLDDIVQQNIQVSSPSGPINVKDIFFINLISGGYIYFYYIPYQNCYKGSVLCNVEIDDIFDDKGLYPELINNHETESMLETWVNDGDISGWTSDDKQIMQMIEDYNHNVLQLRATKKVDASVSGSISQSGQSQTVDLTATNNALNSIANKLKRVETIDDQEVEKNITQTINELNLSNQTVVTTVERAPYNPLLDDGSDIDF